MCTKADDYLDGVGRKPHAFLNEKFCCKIDKHVIDLDKLEALDELYGTDKEIKFAQSASSEVYNDVAQALLNINDRKAFERTMIGFLIGVVFMIFMILLVGSKSTQAQEIEDPIPLKIVYLEESIENLDTELAVYLPASTYDIEFVGGIIHEAMTPQGNNPRISEAEAWFISNEIIYWMNQYEMNQLEDLPYLLSLFYQESRFDPLTQNPHSTAKGLGQILMSMHSHKFDDYSDWSEIDDNLRVSFEILSANYNPSILDPYDRWWRVFVHYSGTQQNARNNMRHLDFFKSALE